MNGQNRRSDQSNASGTATGAVSLPGGSLESGTVAVAGQGSSFGGSGTRFKAFNSSAGVAARFGTRSSANTGEQALHPQRVVPDDGAMLPRPIKFGFSELFGW